MHRISPVTVVPTALELFTSAALSIINELLGPTITEILVNTDQCPCKARAYIDDSALWYKAPADILHCPGKEKEQPYITIVVFYIETLCII